MLKAEPIFFNRLASVTRKWVNRENPPRLNIGLYMKPQKKYMIDAY